MKRILHVAKFYPPASGGMERVVQTLCDASEGIVESRVLALNQAPHTVDEVVNGVPVTRVGVIARAGSVPIAPGLERQLRRAEADLIVLHEPNPWALLSYAIARPKVPLVIWYHSDVVRPALQYALFYAPVARPAYTRARRFVVSSPPLAAHAAALEPYRDRISVIPFGIDESRWTAGSAVDGARAEPFVLFAGRHVPYKGVDVLLRALQGTGIRAVIAGDGPQRATWEALARSLAVDARFPGDVSDDDLRALFAACTAFVLPSTSRAEAFGYVQLEAMASGKPVISTDLPSGVPWVNQHERTGLIVPAGDADALRAGMRRLMDDAPLRARLGREGRARVEAAFTMRHLRERLRAFFAEAA
ncbi:MAG TPA: glycosyltransferase [Vicinamibacterales bacterium]|nr:glycosyltransferase [Vicinamibacterales bacterium]